MRSPPAIANASIGSVIEVMLACRNGNQGIDAMPRQLTRGAKGEDVRALQQGLNEYFGSRRPSLNPDGDFGSRTQAAVEAFQTENPGTGKRSGGFDGIVGDRTWRRLFPLVSFSVTMLGMRLRMPTLGKSGIKPPNLGPGPLRWPDRPTPGPNINPSPFPPTIDWSRYLPSMLGAKLDFTPMKFPGLAKPLQAPQPRVVPSFVLQAPQMLPPPSLVLPVRKMEVAAGTTVNLGSPSETNFSLSISGAYLMGKDGEPHAEFSSGIEVGSPGVDGSGGLTVAWFAQFAGIDLFGKKGDWHFVQPYAQVSVENTDKGPKIGGSLTPFNVSVDLNDKVSLNWETGVAFEYFPHTSNGMVGVESSLGLSISWDPTPPPRHR